LRLEPEEEKRRYHLHENHIEDQRYVDFLTPTLNEIKKRVTPPARGLDYGSGPSPVLAELLKRENYEAVPYDPFFSPVDLSQEELFDFVVSTEVVEHLYFPGEEFKKIFGVLKPEGHLVIRTEFYRENKELEKWHYVRDPSGLQKNLSAHTK
jgi:2-polyprenyl-3-methyl-5-hydroxy-6-metoxy-1,4-benzoquinol methylase